MGTDWMENWSTLDKDKPINIIPNSHDLFIDDIILYPLENNHPSPFAKNYVKVSNVNEDAVWTPFSVNSNGFLDFNQFSTVGSSAITRQVYFGLFSDKEGEAILNIETNHPFVIYQSYLPLYRTSTLETAIIRDYYVKIHLYEGLNRFVIRSFW